MKIGIDFDGVILDTERALKFYADYYSYFELGGLKRKRSDSLSQEKCFDWTPEQKKEFYKKYYILASNTASFLTGAKTILKKLKEEGHELYIVSNRGVRDYVDETKLARERMKELEIEFDGFAWDNENKAETCKRLGIDLMIDDSPVNAKDFIGSDIKMLYFRDVKIERVFADNIKRVDSWMDIYFEANKIEYI